MTRRPTASGHGRPPSYLARRRAVWRRARQGNDRRFSAHPSLLQWRCRPAARPGPSSGVQHDDRRPRPIGAQLMSTQGPLARTVRDVRLAFEMFAGGDPRDTRWVMMRPR